MSMIAVRIFSKNLNLLLELTSWSRSYFIQTLRLSKHPGVALEETLRSSCLESMEGVLETYFGSPHPGWGKICGEAAAFGQG